MAGGNLLLFVTLGFLCFSLALVTLHLVKFFDTTLTRRLKMKLFERSKVKKKLSDDEISRRHRINWSKNK